MGGNGSSADMIVVVRGEKRKGRHWVREDKKVKVVTMRRAKLVPVRQLPTPD